MALINMSLFSRNVMRPVPVTVILPVDPFPYQGRPEREDKPFKTLYLLHAGFGGPDDYLYYTNIKHFAEAHNLAVVIPASDNAFFEDIESMKTYFNRFIGEELVELTRKMFPLSHDREDTFIAGMSMGGYASLKAGLRFSENFGYIAALSAVTITDGVLEENDNKLPSPLGGREFVRAVFGEMETFPTSRHDLQTLARIRKEEGAPMPKILLATGESDHLGPDDERLTQQLVELGYDAEFRSRPGGHDWRYWGGELDYIINEWLPVEEDVFAQIKAFRESNKANDNEAHDEE